jgi:hypothetical protein
MDSHRGLPTVSHGGSWAGYRAELIRFPNQRFAVACLCNLATANPSRLARLVADAYLADVIARADGSPSDRPGARSNDAGTPLVLPAATLRRFAGLYRNPRTAELRRVSVGGDTLYASDLGQRQALVAVDSTVFAMVGAPAAVTLTFEPTGPEGARRVREVRGVADTATFERVAEATPTAADLADYAGRYDSEELGATFTLAVESGRLVVRRRRAEPVTVEPTYRDAFNAGGLLITFTRTGGRVTGMVVNAGRTRNLRFVKRSR